MRPHSECVQGATVGALIADQENRESAEKTDLPSGSSSLRDELRRAEAALRLALAADVCLRCDDDKALAALGFSLTHIANLRSGPRGPRAGYPPYSLRNLRLTVRWLRAALAEPQTEHAV